MNKRKALLILSIVWAVFSLVFLVEFTANIIFNFTYNFEQINDALALYIVQVCFGSIFYIGNTVISVLTAVFCHKSKKHDSEALLLEKEAKEKKKQQRLAKLKNKIDKLEN